MELAAGTRLGPYEIAAPLGSGGMGVVYRARDTRLGRDVAVKLLPQSVVRDEDRLRRFELEARAASALNHPNILAIHDVGSHDGAPYVVAELLEGETLRARLEHGPLAAHRALDFATQVARGLSAAHERGVVHRDLKPENLFVTRDGVVKVLDFGLAKLTNGEAAREGDPTGAPTLTRATTPGSVLGTVGYMSPEQVRGQTVDHRSDIFSFGAVLYEMVTGRRAFQRDSAVETLNAIIKEEPPEPAATGRPLPPGLERVLRHCLEKRPDERFQSARDLVFDLETISGLSVLGSDASGARAGAAARAAARRWGRAVVELGLALIVGTTGFFVGRDSATPQAPSYHQISFRRGSISGARFTPDGGAFVYSAAWDGRPSDVFLGRLDSPDARALDLESSTLHAVARTGEMAVVHKRAGHGATLARVSLTGGPLRDILAGVASADWSADGTEFAVVITAPVGSRLEFPIGRTLVEVTGMLSHPRLSRDGKQVAFLEHPIPHDDRGLVAIVDREGRKRVLSEGWASIEGLAWSPDGREVWFTATRRGALCGLHAVDLSGRVRTLASAPGRLVLHDVAPDGRVLLRHDLTRGEIYALAPGAREERSLTWHDHSFGASLSDDGRFLLFSETGEAGGAAYGVYRRGTDGAPAVRLGEGRPFGLSPDGAWALTLPLDDPPRVVLLPTGAGRQRTLPLGPLTNCDFVGWFPDSRSLLLLAGQPGRGLRLWRLALDGASAARPLTPEGVGSRMGAVRPDGKVLLAYDVRHTPLRPGLYPVEGGEPTPLPALVAGDEVLRWSGDGRALFVATDGAASRRILRVDLETGRRTLLHELRPADPAGVERLSEAQMSADGAAYAYSLRRTLSTLFLAEGVR